MEEAIAAAKKVFENSGASTEEMKSVSENLTKIFQEVAQEMYKNIQSGPQTSERKKTDGDVVDANFEVVDDDKSK
jgi:hypothetical protein